MAPLASRRAVLALTLLLLTPGAARPAPADMALGSPRAKVVVEEFASLACPHCAQFNGEVFPAFRRRYVDTGRVRYVLHELLTPPEQVALAGWLLARCAGPRRYFAVVDQIFESQSRWTDANVQSVLTGIAKANGLDDARIKACLSDQAAIDAFYARSQAAAARYDVNGVPSFVVNGRKVKDGSMSLEELDAAILAAGG